MMAKRLFKLGQEQHGVFGEVRSCASAVDEEDEEKEEEERF